MSPFAAIEKTVVEKFASISSIQFLLSGEEDDHLHVIAAMDKVSTEEHLAAIRIGIPLIDEGVDVQCINGNLLAPNLISSSARVIYTRSQPRP